MKRALKKYLDDALSLHETNICYNLVNQIGFYVYHSYILSSLGADSIPASIAPRCSYLIYKPDRREEVRNIDNDDEG